MEKEADKIEDRNESIEQMEPLLFGEGSKYRSRLTDLAIELAKLSAGFRHSLPEEIVSAPFCPGSIHELLLQQLD